ncbi:hypothetical protein ABW21_db0200802 [Orbilia brochopaga]|nr:hypothetical protein ABW21_db0200802 [Drechslerella brochopaga]
MSSRSWEINHIEHPSTFNLVLPSTELLAGELNSLSSERKAVSGVSAADVDLPWSILLDWAGVEAAAAVGDFPQGVLLLLAKGESIGDGTIGNVGAMSLGVAQGMVRSNVKSLATGNHNVHVRSGLTPGDGGGVALRAVRLDLFRAIRGCVLADEKFLARSSDGAIVDERGRSNRHDCVGIWLRC